jgi:hypothetical protein
MTDDSPSYEDLAREIRTNMADGDPASERYTSLLRNLSEVERLKKEARIKRLSERIDPNVVISAGGSIAGILLVIRAEKWAVLTSKAFSLISKIRI